MVTKANITQPTYNSTRWDLPLNTNFGAINNAIGGIYSASVAASDLTLTDAQAQNLRIVATGVITGNRNISIPSGMTGFWIVTNATTGSYTLTVINSGGTIGVQVNRGASASVFSDGTGVYPCDNSDSTPPGTVISYGGVTVPAGYLYCDGASYASATYPALATALGAAGASFNVPDLRGYFLRGTGTNGDGTVGPAVGAKQADSYLNHNHTADQAAHDHTVNDVITLTVGVAAGTAYSLPATFGSGNTGSTDPAITVATSTTGGTETRPKNEGVLFCIKY